MDGGTQEAFSRVFPKVYTLGTVFPPWELDTFGTMHLSSLSARERVVAMARDMRFGNVDQLVCSEADHFVGNKWSSFTHHVCYLREQRGLKAACDLADIYGRSIDKDMEYI